MKVCDKHSKLQLRIERPIDLNSEKIYKLVVSHLMLSVQ